jgi:SAM-dependent methyltransferase
MSATAFDRIAARYDELWTDTPIGRLQRTQVWQHIDPLFHPGDRIIDVGCGTGADAAHLADRGVIVHATDASAGMVATCFSLLHDKLKLVATLPVEEIATLPGTFDGALSNFGPLNCIADLRPAAAGLAAKIRPGGYLAICTIGRFCLWESLRFAARLQFRKAVRRWSGTAQSSLGPVSYHTVSHMRDVFAPEFELLRWTGIGRFPFIRACADHRLLIFVRK